MKSNKKTVTPKTHVERRKLMAEADAFIAEHTKAQTVQNFLIQLAAQMENLAKEINISMVKMYL